jgi:hypothetical protein
MNDTPITEDDMNIPEAEGQESVIEPDEAEVPPLVKGVLTKKLHKDALIGMLGSLPIGFTLGQLHILDKLLDRLQSPDDVVLTKEEMEVLYPIFTKFNGWSIGARKQLFELEQIIQ